MSKTIIINEDILHSQVLKESILLDSLPNDIKTTLEKNKTSLGLNPVFPEEYGDTFDTKLTIKRFEETKKMLEKIGEIEDCDEIGNAIPKLIEKCRRLEEPIKSNLEKIAYNFVIKLFQLPENNINISDISLTDDLGDFQMGVRFTAEDTEFEFDTVKHKKSLNGEIKKRRVINALITGAAMRIASNIKNYVADIYELDPKLPDLYRKILALNDYMLFITDIKPDENNPSQMGISKIILGNQQTKTDVKIKAMIFPILIYESVKCFLEVIAAHGLPLKKEEANYIMQKADYIQAEPWDMRLGPAMWDSLMRCTNDMDESVLPWFFMLLCKMPVKKFNLYMQEVLAETKKGKYLTQILIDKAINKMEYNDFEKRISSVNSDIAVINDGYIHPDELDEEPTYHIRENNYRNNFTKIKAAKHAYGKTKGKTKDEVNSEISDHFAKLQAINDINKDRDVRNLDPHERQFNNRITADTFNIDFSDLENAEDNIYHGEQIDNESFKPYSSDWHYHEDYLNKIYYDRKKEF